MELIHVSLVCRSIENADHFYGDCLGLEKTATKTLPDDLSNALFGIDEPLTILNYKKNNAFFEIIIVEKEILASNGVNHTCIKVDDIDSFIKRIDSYALKKIEAIKGDKTITFVSDFDGNLFEIK